MSTVSSSMRLPSTSMKRWPTGLMKPMRPRRFCRAEKRPSDVVVLPAFCSVAATKMRGVSAFIARRRGRSSSGGVGVELAEFDGLQTEDGGDTEDVVLARAAREIGAGLGETEE